jgi:hypothetical protein
MDVLLHSPAFFDGMTPADLGARKVASPRGLMERYVASIVAPSREQQDTVYRCVTECIHRMRDIRVPELRDIWSVCKVCLTRDDVEDAMAFTLHDTIFIPESILSTDIVDVFLHECFHVFQRKYADLFTSSLLAAMNFSPAPPTIQKIVSDLHPLRRNPDTYENPMFTWESRTVHAFVYNSPSPDNLNDGRSVSISVPGLDITGPSDFEHPYELTASLFPTIVMSRRPPSTPFETEMVKWMYL